MGNILKIQTEPLPTSVELVNDNSGQGMPLYQIKQEYANNIHDEAAINIVNPDWKNDINYELHDVNQSINYELEEPQEDYTTYQEHHTI